MIYLLDTDTTILLLRGLSTSSPKTDRQRKMHERGHRILAACRHHSASGAVIGLSAITIAELEFGACGADDPSKERARMQRFLAPFSKFDFGTDQPTRHYGEIRSTLESLGQSIGPNDLLIAAHALALSATLVTNNPKEFKRIQALTCANWAA